MIEDLPAFDLAAHWHSGQLRKGLHREPFVKHPMRVAKLLIQHGFDDADLINAALLHDILEDTDCPPEALREQTNDQVLSWVLEVSDRKDYLKSLRKQIQVERAEMLSPQAKLIRLADKIDNVESLLRDPPQTWSWQRKREYVAWADRVVKALGPVDPGLEALYQETRDRVWQTVTGQSPVIS